jgi:hypothetical protein
MGPLAQYLLEQYVGGGLLGDGSVGGAAIGEGFDGQTAAVRSERDPC